MLRPIIPLDLCASLGYIYIGSYLPAPREEGAGKWGVWNQERCCFMLNQQVLVLNKYWVAVHICTVRRALTLLFQELARVVTDDLQTHDFESWRELSAFASFSPGGSPNPAPSSGSGCGHRFG